MGRAPRESYLTSSHFPSAGVPIICVTSQDAYEEESDEEFDNILPLPASKYRYSKWSELNETDITSDMLRCPRIRKAPSGFKVDTILMLEEQELAENNIQKPARRKRWGKSKKKDYTNKLENWETCEYVNLSYQNLGHGYQMKEFIKVLRRLVRADMVELIENNLTDLSSVFFPSCRFLFLQRNHITNIKKLPRLNNIEHLSLQQNNISTLKGLDVLQDSSIKALTLRDNPVSLQQGYRAKVFEILPQLVLLDDLPFNPDKDRNNVNNDVRTMCKIT